MSESNSKSKMSSRAVMVAKIKAQQEKKAHQLQEAAEIKIKEEAAKSATLTSAQKEKQKDKKKGKTKSQIKRDKKRKQASQAALARLGINLDQFKTQVVKKKAASLKDETPLVKEEEITPETKVEAPVDDVADDLPDEPSWDDVPDDAEPSWDDPSWDDVAEEEEDKINISEVSVKTNSKGKKDKAGNKKTEDTPEKKKYRSPVICVMGHVDTGKTSLLDKLRKSDLQSKEAGGITQQIAATYFTADYLKKQINKVNPSNKFGLQYHSPGVLMIDTPGHESFANLRNRGSSICDLAILVIDVMHGLEPQTLESIQMLKKKKTPFVVILNKIDRCYGWTPLAGEGIRKSIRSQKNTGTVDEVERRIQDIKYQLQGEGFNSELYFKNKDLNKNICLVPTSAVTGEGVPDLMLLIVKLTEEKMAKKMSFKEKFQATVLDVTKTEGYGTTVDAILLNGKLKVGDGLMFSTLNGPIVTNVKALLTPKAMTELRSKSSFHHNEEVEAACGVKIVTHESLDKVLAGTSVEIVEDELDFTYQMESMEEEMKGIMKTLHKDPEGVYVHASSLGALEALMDYLRAKEMTSLKKTKDDDKKKVIPVAEFGIGTVFHSDVIKAEICGRKKKEYGSILAFDVKISEDARKAAHKAGIRIFEADIIYHLYDNYSKYLDQVRTERLRETQGEAVFPCKLEILPDCIFHKKRPIVMGVRVLAGTLRKDTLICIRKGSENMRIGRVVSIEDKKKELPKLETGRRAAIKIHSDDDSMAFGNQFTEKDMLYSHISRKSIDLIKELHRDEMTQDDWKLMIELKRTLKVN